MHIGLNIRETSRMKTVGEETPKILCTLNKNTRHSLVHLTIYISTSHDVVNIGSELSDT